MCVNTLSCSFHELTCSPHADSTRYLQGKRTRTGAISSAVLERLAASLTTRLYLPDVRPVRAALKDASFEEFTRLAVPDGGDVIRSSAFAAVQADSRNASWVRVRVY
jgi:hypothetical protein